MTGGQKDRQGTPSPSLNSPNNMTRKAARSISAWMFILAVVLILTALFYFHWIAGVMGVGALLWALSTVLWTWSQAAKDVADEK